MKKPDKEQTMSIIQPIERTISLSSEKEVRQICQYLTQFGITHFSYIKCFADGTHFSLSTHNEWMKYFYENNFKTHGVFHKTIDAYQSGVNLWNSLEDQSSFLEFKDHYGISNGIVLIDKQAQTCELYNFAGDENDYSINNFYINNLNILWRHTYYFKEKARSLIHKAQRDRLILPKCNLPKKPAAAKKSGVTAEISSLAPLKRYYIQVNSKETYLTAIEVNCCHHLLKGKSIKEIANHLTLSPRTVETHLLNIKNKLNCDYKSDLINFLLDQTTLQKIFVA